MRAEHKKLIEVKTAKESEWFNKMSGFYNT